MNPLNTFTKDYKEFEMTQINHLNQSATTQSIANPSAPHHATLPRDVVLCTTAGIIFMQTCTFSAGWFLPVTTYILAMAALLTTIKRHHAGVVNPVWIYAINALGCTGLVSALWFSGKMATMF